MFARYVRTIRTADGVAVMFTTLAFFLMVVVLMLAVIGDALWSICRGADLTPVLRLACERN
jgi:hypothetical protein